MTMPTVFLLLLNEEQETIGPSPSVSLILFQDGSILNYQDGSQAAWQGDE